MRSKLIPDEIRQQVDAVIAKFNADVMQGTGSEYSHRFQGQYLYLSRRENKGLGQICRLRYAGDFEQWEFAIYKYSTGGYDPNEWMFPGSQFVDGTIEGAMYAGLYAYPF